MPQCYPQVTCKAIPLGYLPQGVELLEGTLAENIARFGEVDGMGRGAIAKIATDIEVDPNYLSRCLYPSGKKGKKNIGDELVHKLNLRFPHWSQEWKSGFIEGESRRIEDKKPIPPDLNPDCYQIDAIMAMLNKASPEQLEAALDAVRDIMRVKDKRPIFNGEERRSVSR